MSALRLSAAALEFRREFGLPDRPGDPVPSAIRTGSSDAGGKLICNPSVLRADTSLCNYRPGAAFRGIGAAEDGI